MPSGLDDITDRQAVLLLRAVACHWVKERGAEAFVVNQHFDAVVKEKELKDSGLDHVERES